MRPPPRSGLDPPLRELEIRFVRSSGPGGQNVNKVATKAVLRWPVARSPSLRPDVRDRFLQRWARRITQDGDLLLTSDRFRDQGRNAADCVAKLRAMLEVVAEPPRPRKPTRPSRAAKERRIAEKRHRSLTKQRRASPGEE